MSPHMVHFMAEQLYRLDTIMMNMQQFINEIQRAQSTGSNGGHLDSLVFYCSQQITNLTLVFLCTSP